MEYTKLTDKILKLIISQLHERFEEEDEDIFDDDNCFSNYITEIIEDVIKYFGIKIKNDTDLSFFIALCRLNPTAEGEIKRPKHNTFDVYHQEYAHVSKTTTYKQQVGSFLDLNKDILSSMRETDYYIYYEGNVVDEEEYSYDVSDDNVTDVIKLNRK
jgi:hypothetical protein